MITIQHTEFTSGVLLKGILLAITKEDMLKICKKLDLYVSPNLKNVYMYLDDELVDTEHLCCLAHARAKFKTAYDQGCEQARFFLEKMGALYQLEEDYRRLELSAQEIKTRRNDASTSKIVDDLRNELFDLLALPKDEKNDLMQRALNYLHSFWKQLFAYRNNGEYTIDNLAAFGSTKGVLNSVVYNTFIETCKAGRCLVQGLLPRC